MMSTVSFKDKLKQAFSIFKWDLKSCSGTMAVYSIIAAAMTIIVFTLALTLGIAAMDSDESLKGLVEIVNTVSMQGFQIAASSIIFFLTIIFTVFYTVKVFSYLHNKRKADLYGSLPISRVMLFTSKAAAALLFTLIPAMFFMGIISLVSVMFGQPIIAEVTDMYIKLIIGSISSISFYGLISVCCGTTVNAVIMFLSVCFAYPLSASFIKGIIGAFLYGFNTDVIGRSFVINALNPISAYDGKNIIYWLLFTVACLVGAGFLVRKRKAERAQASFAYYLPCHIIKVIIAFLVGMILGVLFGSLNVLGGLPGFVFGFIIGSVPAFIIVHLIFYKGFTNLLKTSIPLGALVVVVVLGVSLISFDVFGYSTYVPHKDDVESAGFIDLENFYGDVNRIGSIAKNASEDFTDSNSINAIINNHYNIAFRYPEKTTEKFVAVWYNIFYDSVSMGIMPVDNACAFSYKLKDGSVVTRYYSFLAMNMYNQGQTHKEIDNTNIFNSKKYVEKYSSLANVKNNSLQAISIYGNNGKKELAAAKINSNNSKVDKKITEKDIQKILDAYRKDFEADTVDSELALWIYRLDDSGNYNYYDFDDCSYFYTLLNSDKPVVCQLSFDFKVDPSSMGLSNALFNVMERSKTESFIVPKSYTNTISVLKEIGILDDSLCISSDSDYFQKYFAHQYANEFGY